MAKPYSMDLRKRVVDAVVIEGQSRNLAAARFGVAVSTAIGWVRRFQASGDVSAGQMGGHKPRKISGEHEAWLSGRLRDGEFTLHGLVAELAKRGLAVDSHTVWDFVRAAGFRFKKRRWSPVSGAGRTSSAVGANG